MKSVNGPMGDQRRHDNVSNTLWPVLFKTILAITVRLGMLSMAEKWEREISARDNR